MQITFEGPEEELTMTINAQPAVVTVSYAYLEVMRDKDSHKIMPQPTFVAGHSLGEYTALAAAKVFDFPTAVYLARERGRLMHKASLIRQSSGWAKLL
ncbi:ACP S-malonyltransferase [Chloroflexota bacterium]